jgi:hypothetical protein
MESLKEGFYLWCTSCTPNLKTDNGKPLSEKDATVMASKFDSSRRIVIRPAYYEER